jgi:hypothetical protein
VIAPVGSRDVTSPAAKIGFQVTLLLGINAIGETSIPLYIFQGKRLPTQLLKDDSSYLLGVQKSGWMDKEVFTKFIRRFEMDIREKRGARKNEEGKEELEPVLILADQHSSRFNLESAWYAKQHGIEILLSPPSSSHLLQPLDVGVFGPLKTYFAEAKIRHSHNGLGRGLTKAEVVPLSLQALRRVEAKVIRKAFATVGIWPSNAHALDSKFGGEPKEKEKQKQEMNQLKARNKSKSKSKSKSKGSSLVAENRALRQRVQELERAAVQSALRIEVLESKAQALEESSKRSTRKGPSLPKSAHGCLLTGDEGLALAKSQAEEKEKKEKEKGERKAAMKLRKEQKEQEKEENKYRRAEQARAREAKKAEDAHKKEAARALKELQREEKKRKEEEQKGQGARKRQKKEEKEDREQEQEQEQEQEHDQEQDREQEQEQEQDRDHDQEQEHQEDREDREDPESPCRGRGGAVREALEFFNALLNASPPSSPSSSSPSSSSPPSSPSLLDDDLGSTPLLSPLELPPPEPPGASAKQKTQVSKKFFLLVSSQVTYLPSPSKKISTYLQVRRFQLTCK